MHTEDGDAAFGLAGRQKLAATVAAPSQLDAKKKLLEPLRLPRSLPRGAAEAEDASEDHVRQSRRALPLMDLSRLRRALDEEVKARLDRVPDLVTGSSVRDMMAPPSAGRRRRAPLLDS